MTDSGEQERATELARAVFRAVPQYVADTLSRDTDAMTAARGLGEALGLEMADVAEAPPAFSGEGVLAAGGRVLGLADAEGRTRRPQL